MKKGILQSLTIALLFANTLFAQSSLNVYWDGDAGDGLWTTKENWDNDLLPRTNDDAIINISASVVLDSNLTVESLTIGGGGNLTIASGVTLNTSKGGPVGSDGVRLTGASGNESTLQINGKLNINNAPGDGMDINDYSSVTVGSGGELSISNSSGDAIEIGDDLINSGTITITNPTQSGIRFSSVVPGGAAITNNSSGIINITGGIYGIELNNDIYLTNDGTISISGTSDKIFKGSGNGNLYNNGTFGGEGVVDANDFINGGTGSAISPGTSPGQLTFDEDSDFSDSSFEIELNGPTSPGTDYDQIIMLGKTDITDVTLNLSGSHIPGIGDEFIILDNTAADPVSGTFDGLPEGATLVFNGTQFIHFVFGRRWK